MCRALVPRGLVDRFRRASLDELDLCAERELTAETVDDVLR